MYDPAAYTEEGAPSARAGHEDEDPSSPAIAFPNAKYSAQALQAAKDVINQRLSDEAAAAQASSLSILEMTELHITQPTELNVTLISSAECRRHSLGLVVLPGNLNPRTISAEDRRQLLDKHLEFSIFFPNVDYDHCDCLSEQERSAEPHCAAAAPHVSTGSTIRLKPDSRSDPDNYVFPADCVVSFFLLEDGFDEGFSPGRLYTSFAEQLLFSTQELNDPRWEASSVQGAEPRTEVFHITNEVVVDEKLAGVAYDFSEAIFFAWQLFHHYQEHDGIDGIDGIYGIDGIDGIDSIDGIADGGDNGDNDGVESFVMMVEADPPLLGSSDAFCQSGIRNTCGNVCCKASCESCGGADVDCTARGPAEECCPGTILFSGIHCTTPEDVGCILDVPISCVDDVGGSKAHW
eukprot:scaffold1411_cov252-Pinguiococcus_pyrenoidosus.AAC.14